MQNLFVKTGMLALLLLSAACSKSGQTSGPSTGKGPTGLPSVPGEPDTSVQTALPPVPSFVSVNSSIVGDSVAISVEPIAGAKDYRVYVLPSDDDITATADGHVTVKNAIYRCAGNRQTPRVSADAEEKQKSEAIKTVVQDVAVEGYMRTLDNATLGYVYLKAGDGRVPVYAMGDSGPEGDNTCFHQRWTESRNKKYVVSEAERNELLAAKWRDDGIVFYVPADGSDGSKPIYTASVGASTLYFVDGPEADDRGGGKQTFSVLSALPDPQPADVAPLMRTYYQAACATQHDELSAGLPRFERARFQGDQLPMFDLHWSGITEQTTLVVEALDAGCPLQAVLTPVSRDAALEDQIDYPKYSTIADVQAASDTGEVFINGQAAATSAPRPIARTFLKVKPGPKPEMDWFAGFGPDETIPDFMAGTWDEPCEDPDGPSCLFQYRQKSDFGDVSFLADTPNRNGIGVVQGELWVTYADVGADVGGKFRITPNTRATMSATTYLHVTMEVDTFTTARRYPQIFISDAQPPVQWRLFSSNTVLLQTFRDEGTTNWPTMFQVQVCDHRIWEVNNQCPTSDLYRYQGADGKVTGIAPLTEGGESTGVDRSTRWDGFVSTKRVYFFVDNKPYGCLDLPEKGVPSGEVTVTFGDVLYHSGVDYVFGFHEKNQKVFTKRHFDNLGFKSGVEGPEWDEKRFPCFPASNLTAH